MRRPAALFPIAVALGAMVLAPEAGAQTEIGRCRTIGQPGSYKLVNNLVATGPNCLVITAGLVTIDLAGFTISGTTAGSAILQSSGQGIVVRNGSISGFAIGVNISFSPGSIVEGLRVAGSGPSSEAGIFANGGIVKGNTVSRTSEAIIATGIVSGNDVRGNSIGIVVGAGSTVIGNTANDNDAIGIFAICPVNLTDNTAVNNNQVNLMLNGDGCNNTNNVAP
jgi:hypothetical protein